LRYAIIELSGSQQGALKPARRQATATGANGVRELGHVGRNGTPSGSGDDPQTNQNADATTVLAPDRRLMRKRSKMAGKFDLYKRTGRTPISPKPGNGVVIAFGGEGVGAQRHQIGFRRTRPRHDRRSDIGVAAKELGTANRIARPDVGPGVRLHTAAGTRTRQHSVSGHPYQDECRRRPGTYSQKATSPT
jgi:hypothetical protein